MNIMSSLIAILVLPSLVACGATPTTSPTATPERTTQATTETSEPTSDLREVALGMGFIPNIQFAPFYVADAKGYFQENGLQIEFNYGTEDDLLRLIGTDKLQFAIGSGDQVILARSQGLPAVYVANFYRQFPVSIASLKGKNIVTPKDLEGKKVGIPGLFGASYIGWLALSHATDIDTGRVDLQSIGFTQAAMLEQDRVDAAVVYIVNTPVQLRMANKEVNEIRISDFVSLVSNGIITNEQTIDRDPELVRDLVGAFLKGLRDTLDDPDEALDITLQYVPEAGGDNLATTKAVLEASIELWQGDNLGVSRREDWQESQDSMREMGRIDHKTEVDKLFTNTFVTGMAD